MKSFLFILCFLSFLSIFTSCLTKPDPEWSKWRGPHANGIITGVDLAPEKLDSAHIIWTKDIGFGHSSVTVSGNKCFASGWKEWVNGNDTITKSTLYCLHTKNGREIWSFHYPSKKTNFPGPRSTPVVDDERVYTLGWEGVLYCLETKTGTLLWQTDLAKDSLTVPDDWGYNPSPVIYDHLVLLNLNQSGIALDKYSGQVVWNSPPKKSHYASVQIVNNNGQSLGVFMSDTTMYFVEPLTGKVAFSHARLSTKGMENDVMVPYPGYVYTSNALYEMLDNGLILKWQNDTVSSSFRTGLVQGDYAYQFSLFKNKHDLYCVDLKSGNPVWKTDLGRWGSLMAVNDYLVVLTGLGKVLIARATPEHFQPIKELQVFSSENKEENWCWAQPSFSSGKLFIRNSKGEMACLDLRR
ncbi:MAG TPA: PQQ-binding-like beta-propeller repeat protein, partial [Prolixibacteraceae bacterium]|nr:PQQ-binding-like beta-propeller repeat protein [Prolixibacteraceae bacterium]